MTTKRRIGLALWAAYLVQAASASEGATLLKAERGEARMVSAGIELEEPEMPVREARAVTRAQMV